MLNPSKMTDKTIDEKVSTYDKFSNLRKIRRWYSGDILPIVNYRKSGKTYRSVNEYRKDYKRRKLRKAASLISLGLSMK